MLCRSEQRQNVGRRLLVVAAVAVRSNNSGNFAHNRTAVERKSQPDLTREEGKLAGNAGVSFFPQ